MATQPLNRLAGLLGSAYAATRLGAEADAALLDRCRKGNDRTAFEALVRRHGARVLAACRKVLSDPADIDDAFQATFLVLLQRPRAVRKADAVGSWLYGVAHRIAVRARDTAARRRALLKKAVPASEEAPVAPDLSWREACAALHAELDRLPDTLRLPLVLCYLEGLSRDEAAQQLGWTVNEVRGRLERGRDRLRKRLVKRGIALSAGLLAAAAGGGSVTAGGPPARLIECVMRAAAGRPSARAAALAHGVCPAMIPAKLKLLSALVLAAGLVLGAGARDPNPPAAPKADTPGAAGRPASARADNPADDPPPELAGRVLDPNGRPVAGAKVWLIEPWQKAREVTRTAADGTFRLPVGERTGKLTEIPWVVRVVATHERFGLALPVGRPGGELELRLVKDDVPVRGRVLDLQGKPVAGAALTPVFVRASPDESLDPLLTRLKAAEDQVNLVTDAQVRRKVSPTPFLPPVTTDAQGRFTLTGVGRERLVELRVEGPTVATTEIRVLTRATPDLRVEYDPGNPKLGYRVYHGATFDFAADPTQPFQGVVTDKATGKPIPKAVVRSVYPYRIEAVADEGGKYALRGLGPGEHRLIAGPPAGEPYLPLLQAAGRPNNHQPVSVDFALTRGEWVEGRLTDARTRKPIPGATLYYSPLNAEVVRQAGGDPAAFEEPVGRTDADGRFRIPAAPGPGGIAVHAPFGPYIGFTRRPLQGDSLFWTHEGVRTKWTQLYFSSFDALAVVELDPKRARRYELTVDPGEKIKGRVLDPDGKPLAGARASRLTEHGLWTPDPLGAAIVATQVQSGKPRFVLLWHEGRKLGAIWRPEPGKPDTCDVRLKPNGSAAGRLVDKDGQPVPDQLVQVYFRTPGDPAWSHWFPMKEARTDATGRFELRNLPEGAEFNVRAMVRKGMAQVHHAFRVKSGEVHQLGDVRAE